MKSELFLGLNTNARNAFVLLTAGNVVALLIILIMLITMSGRETVVRMPAPLNSGEDMVISQSGANEAYLESWAWWTANMVGNINRDNADDTIRMLNRIMTDRLYDRMSEDLRASVENMRIQGFRLRFRPSRVFHHENGRTYVVGELEEIPLRGEVVATRFTYEMQFDIRFGLPRLSQFRAYEGGPQT
jgi:hypothetical protein